MNKKPCNKYDLIYNYHHTLGFILIGSKESIDSFISRFFVIIGTMGVSMVIGSVDSDLPPPVPILTEPGVGLTEADRMK